MVVSYVQPWLVGGADAGDDPARDARPRFQSYPLAIMTSSSSSEPDPVAWARWLNARWIVHAGLDERAEAFMAHLESVDPERLAVACDRAARMLRICGSVEDPKPWFYSGLFSSATLEEAELYLKDHWFTAQCVPALADHSQLRAPLEEVGVDAKAKITRVRKALSELG